MEFDTQYALYWAVFGITLMLAELILPGLVVLFLGMAAVIVAACIYFGFIHSFVEMMLWWFVISILLIVFLRSLFAKLLPSFTEKQSIDEDAHAVGQIVKVEKRIQPNSKEGRIQFRGSTWNATCERGFSFEPGDQVRITKRIGLLYFVESIEQEGKN